ncbi:MAG: NTP transferase domain-containing protein [Atopobium sp.]|nr:NTP transferase domain-containing protein [Atopobium sp.]
MAPNILVILAGGSGVRYKADKPKQYTTINGKELLEYSIDEMKLSGKTDKILVVLNNDPEAMARVRKDYGVEVLAGGKERAYSFQNALDYVKAHYPECKKIIFHEAARPLVHHDVIDKYFDLLDEYDYVETCKKISDSLGSYVMQAPRREDYYLIQAPEAYKFSVLNQYYDCDSDIYFAANQFPAFIKGYQYFDIQNNLKLTNPDDKVLIEYLLNKENRHS